MAERRQEVVPFKKVQLRGETCKTIHDALKKDRYYGISDEQGLILLNNSLNKDEVNVRVAQEAIKIVDLDSPDESYTRAERSVIVPCPEDTAQRCGKCILDAVGGVKTYEAVIQSPSSETHSAPPAYLGRLRGH